MEPLQRMEFVYTTLRGRMLGYISIIIDEIHFPYLFTREKRIRTHLQKCPNIKKDGATSVNFNMAFGVAYSLKKIAIA